MVTFVFHSLILCALSLKLYPPPSRSVLIIESSLIDEEVPGIQYISRGYNILFGNPHTTAKVDDGIRGSIFDLLNCSHGQTFNGYLVPNGVSILPASTCAQTFKYNAVSGVNSYSSTLKESASVDADFLAVSFSASTDYQKVYSTTTKTSTIYTSSYTQCACYYASVKAPYALPSFDDNFIGSVQNMPLKYDSSDDANLQFFYDFFTKYFGTHYITDITMGGIFGTLSSMNSFSYSKYESSNLEISVSAKLSTLVVSGAASSLTTSQKTQANDFNSILNTQSVFNIGGDLPANNSAITWQKTLSTKPMPIYYKFDPIPHLLTMYNFPDIDNITDKQTALQSALDDYCHILSTNDTFGTIECSGYPPDPEIPKKSIIKGFYTDNIDNEPKNPYTGGYNCNEGYTPILYGKYKSQHNVVYSSYYCINLTEIVDGLHYFGGMYEVTTSSGACKIGNVFTSGKCSCFDGLTTQMAAAAINGGDVDVNVYLCYNATTPLDHTIIGGFYSTTSNTQNRAPIVNPYTKTTSCPSGFTAYHTGTECVYHDGCKESLSTYVCLNNIYPVG
eukprot:273939_1